MKKIAITVLLCLLAQAGNLLTSFLVADVCRLPLFFDTAFSVAVTFYAGFVPGVAVAASYNFLRIFFITLAGNRQTYPSEGLYFLCGVAIVVITWFFSRDKQNFRITWYITALYLVLIALLTAFASSIIGAGVVNLSLEVGASAYVSKADDERELVKAMGKVLAGESYLARSVVPKLLTYQNIVEGFSRREKEILTLVLQGLLNKQIAERLGIHKRAVENYISRIYDKTGFSTRAELVDQLSLEEL